MKLDFNTLSHQNVEDPLLDIVPRIAWYTNRKLQSCLTVDDNRSYWEYASFHGQCHRQNMPLLDFRLSDLGNQPFPTCSHSSITAEGVSSRTVVSLVIGVFGPVFAWEASREPLLPLGK
jgi:hypothetical protein